MVDKWEFYFYFPGYCLFLLSARLSKKIELLAPIGYVNSIKFRKNFYEWSKPPNRVQTHCGTGHDATNSLRIDRYNNRCQSNLRKASDIFGSFRIHRTPNIFEHLGIYLKSVKNIFWILRTLKIFGKLRTSSVASVSYTKHLRTSQERLKKKSSETSLEFRVLLKSS